VAWPDATLRPGRRRHCATARPPRRGGIGAAEREPRSGGERVLRAELGFLGGLGCGFTPGCGLAHQVAVETKVLSRGDTHSAVGWSVGVTLGGLFLTALGGVGDAAGGVLSATGIGAVRQLGALRGLFTVPDDFDAPLPDDVLRALLWVTTG